MPRAEHRRRSSAIGDARRPKERNHRRNGCDGGDLGQGGRLCYAVPACGRHKWRPYVPRLQLFCMIRHAGLVGLSACRNAASRNTPHIGAPSVTLVAQKGGTTGGTGATAGILGRDTVFVTPFRRAGVTSGAPTYHVCSFSA